MEGETKEVIIVRKYAKWPFVLIGILAFTTAYFFWRAFVLVG
jgi:type VI protein secretion system component VasF